VSAAVNSAIRSFIEQHTSAAWSRCRRVRTSTRRGTGQLTSTRVCTGPQRWWLERTAHLRNQTLRAWNSRHRSRPAPVRPSLLRARRPAGPLVARYHMRPAGKEPQGSPCAWVDR
jgi:hypothetical protein